jgi:hypothetical protein
MGGRKKKEMNKFLNSLPNNPALSRTVPQLVNDRSLICQGAAPHIFIRIGINFHPYENYFSPVCK